MSEDQPHSPTGSARGILPWLVAAATFLLYLVTLNRWVTLGSLPIVAKVTGWDWSSTITYPLLHLITLPFRLLPESVQPVALNGLSALCAAMTLGILAKSVALLPHDRSREQRQRLRGEDGLLSGALAWLPPLLAALACGLQLTFWENATAITGEMINLLLFAYVIYCLLAFRVDRRDARLYRLALVYGLAVTNSHAMIAFFPLFLIATIWIKGIRFFAFGFLMRMLGLGVLGMLLYLLVPILEVMDGASEATLIQMLRSQLGSQKSLLLFEPLRTPVLVLSFTSIVPVIFMGIRWPSTFGDMSAAGAAITALMFRIIHALFLVAALYVTFDPPYSPRELGLGLPFLSFYYLGALSIGYFSGYFLLVCGKEPEKRWRKPTPGGRLINQAIVGCVILAVVGVPAGLAMKNWPAMRMQNGPELEQFASHLIAGIPDEESVVFSDEPQLLLLAAAVHAGSSRAAQPLWVLASNLKYRLYNTRMANRYPDRWHDLDLTDQPPQLDSLKLLEILDLLCAETPAYYLHFSFGEFFEKYYQIPRGMGADFKLFEEDVFRVPALTDGQVQFNLDFWQELVQGNDLDRLERQIQGEHAPSEFLGTKYSKALNNWGVRLQREGKAGEAGAFFTQALVLNTNNVAAEINLLYSQRLAAGRSDEVVLPQEMRTQLDQYRNNWRRLLQDCGPIDEPNFCYELGNVFAQGSLDRQAAQQYARALELDPTHIQAGIRLANTYLKRRVFDDTIALAKELSTADIPDMTVTNRLELVRLRAWAHFGRDEMEQAEALLREANGQYPDFPEQLVTLAQMQNQKQDYEAALKTIDESLDRLPNHQTTLFLKSTVLFNQKAFQSALEPLNRVLNMDPENRLALMRRGLLYMELEQFEAAEADFTHLLEIAPKFNPARLQLARATEKQGQREEAVDLYREFLDTEPGDSPTSEAVKERLKELESSP